MLSLLVLVLLLGVLLLVCKCGHREAGLPPGPSTLPFIGNLHIFPTQHIHKFTEWAHKYGGIYSLKIGPTTAIVLSDPSIVKDLMERRSATSSDRPRMHIGDVIHGGLNIAFISGGDTWRTLRRAAHAVLKRPSAALHIPIQQAEAIQLLNDMLNAPEAFYSHVDRYSNSVILSVVYGKRAPRKDTPELVAFFQVLHDWLSILEPGAAPPVDLIPALKLIPDRWAKWKRTARRIRQAQRRLLFGLLEAVEDRVSRGRENGSFVEQVLAKQTELRLDREMTAYLAGALVEGGSETTSAYLNSFILCLVAFPEAQRKAQDEMDRVVGKDRLPTLDDLHHLSYVRAIILETHRFRPNVPLFIPHAFSASEKVGEYIIPSGSTVFVNAWGILHDPVFYDDPEAFVPERFLLTTNGTKPALESPTIPSPNLTFRVGRRSCPGIHLAQNAININVMNLIWAFDFQPDVHADGSPIQPDISVSAYTKGIMSTPLPFKCTITPRSLNKADIIRREFEEAASVFDKFE
ncbi:cytochrome P450 [Roridomyces roridus]|uniref:Cytochrome P450 n=1 Tax=Roridomyces roridus TaxID=1738132 RepID=A0AAD7B8H7_9AGAR|nr:cytochrome P450 [Roridomyces roridus]